MIFPADQLAQCRVEFAVFAVVLIAALARFMWLRWLRPGPPVTRAPACSLCGHALVFTATRIRPCWCGCGLGRGRRHVKDELRDELRARRADVCTQAALAEFWGVEAARAAAADLDRRLGPELVNLMWDLWEGELRSPDPEADAIPAIVRWHAAREVQP